MEVGRRRGRGAQASAKVATFPPFFPWLGAGEAGRPLGRGGTGVACTSYCTDCVYFSCAGVRVSLTQIISVGQCGPVVGNWATVGSVWNIAAAFDWP